MYSPQYLRHRQQSLATTADDGEISVINKGDSRMDGGDSDNDEDSLDRQRRERDEEQLRLAGLRRRSLMLLFAWLGAISFLALLLLVLHISLILVLQMSPKGMRSLRIFTYEDPKTGREEPAVHFSANRVHLGQVVAGSGQVLGQRNENLEIHGSRVLIGAANRTKAIFQEGECRIEGAQQFQVRQSGANGKILFSARHPLVGIDKRIKRIASGHIITNKLRAPVDESMHISAEDLGLRGNERIQMEARSVNFTAGTGIRLATSALSISNAVLDMAYLRRAIKLNWKLLLTRSAMPSLSKAANSSFAPGQPAPMDWSLMSMSTGSTNSGGSLAKFLDDDLMAHSHATYTVFESDCLMLSDLELSDSAALLRFDEEEDENDTATIGLEEEWARRNNFVPAEQSQLQQNRMMDESVILDGPTLFAMDLPVIDSPDSALVDETPTPMAENHSRNFETGLTQMHWEQQQQQRERVVDRRNRNNLGLNGLGMRNGSGGNEENSPSMRKNSPNNNSNNVTIRQTPTTELVKGGERRRKMMANGVDDARNNNNNRDESSTNATGEDSSGRGKSREKKPRVSVFQSIPMPSQNLSAAARSKPKQPTKAQLVMEQLKASMEAEKQRPKREIRSKLQPPTPTNGVKVKEEIKAQLVAEQKAGMEPEKLEKTKEIRSKLPPANLVKKEKEENGNGQDDVKHTNTINNQQQMKKAGSRIQSIGSGAGSRIQSTIGLAGSGARRVFSSHSTHQQTSTAAAADSEIAKLKQQLDQLKQQLERREREHAEALEKQLAESKAEKANADTEIAELKQQLEQRECEYAKRLERQLASSKAEQTEAIEKVECGWQAKLTETNEKHEQELARVRCDLSTMHLDELQSVRVQHQKAIDELNERLNLLTAQMAEQTIEYEVKMKESESARNRRLNDELASLQFALQLKNEAVQKLRCENRELIIQTEKIAEKDAQITKFGKKNEDLNEEVNRLKQIEKNLISQLNEFRRELDETRAKCKEMGMEREVLEYQLQEQIERGSDSTTPLSTPKMSKYREFSPHGSRSSHHYVNIRTPDSQQKSTGRPNSSCWPSQGRPIEFEGDMSKSMDSAMSQSVISCYRQEGRSKSQNTPNKIYTPREFYEANDSSSLPPPTSAAKRIVDFQDCSGDDGNNDNDNVDDNPTKALLDPAAEAK